MKGAKAIWQSLGAKRKIYKQEEEIVSWARESVVSTQNIAKGTVIGKEMIAIKRPSPTKGVIAAKEYDLALGKKAIVDIAKDKQIKWDYLVNE